MPAYNFKKEFVPMILDGSKPHTIRRRRKRPTRVGDVLYLFTGLRTKQCKLVAISECVKIEPILLIPEAMIIWISSSQVDINESNMRPLSIDEINDLAHRDGFEDTYDFFDFFKRYKEGFLYDFEIIWWSVDLLMPVNGNRKGGEYRMRLGAK